MFLQSQLIPSFAPKRDVQSILYSIQQEGSMPLEELLAMYRYEPSVSTAAGSSMDSSSGELTDELPDMTLDKVSYSNHTMMVVGLVHETYVTFFNKSIVEVQFKIVDAVMELELDWYFESQIHCK